MLDGKPDLKQVNDYITYLNDYLGNCPSGLLGQLIKEETVFLTRQQNLAVNYNSVQLQILFYVNHLKRQQLTFEKLARAQDLTKEARRIAAFKGAEYELLKGKVGARYLPGHQITIPLDEASIDEEYQALVIRTFTEQVYAQLIAVLQAQATARHFNPIDLSQLKQKARVKCINQYMTRDAIRQLDTLLIIQKYASLSDSESHHKERGALRRILDTASHHSIGPHLIPSEGLANTFRMAERPTHVVLTLDGDSVVQVKDCYHVALTPDNVRVKDNKVVIIFEENAKLDIYARTQLTLDASRVVVEGDELIISLDSTKVNRTEDEKRPDAAPKYSIRLDSDHMNEIDEELIESCFSLFMEDRQLTTYKAGSDLKQEKEQLVYMNSVPCRVDEDDYLVRDYTHTKDTEFERFSKAERGRLTHKDKARFLYEIIDDTNRVLSQALARTNHAYVPLTTYFSSSDPMQLDTKTFLDEQLALYKRALSRLSCETEDHDLPVFVLEGRVDSACVTKAKVMKSLDRPLTLKTAMHSSVEEYSASLQTVSAKKMSASQKKSVTARQKGVLTLCQYLSRREVDLHFINEAFAYHIERIHTTVKAILSQPDRLTKEQLAGCTVLNKQVEFFLSNADVFSTGPSLPAYHHIEMLSCCHSYLSVQSHLQMKIPELDSYLKTLLDTFTRLSELKEQQSSHLAVTVETVLDIVAVIECHSPTWSERDRLVSMKEKIADVYQPSCMMMRTPKRKETFMMTTERTMHALSRKLLGNSDKTLFKPVKEKEVAPAAAAVTPKSHVSL